MSLRPFDNSRSFNWYATKTGNKDGDDKQFLPI